MIYHSNLVVQHFFNTVKPLLRGHPDQRPPPLEMPLDTVNLNITVLISNPDERPSLLKDHFSESKGVASQEGFHCSYTKSGDKNQVVLLWVQGTITR